MSALWQVGVALSQKYGLSIVPIREDAKIPPVPWALYQAAAMPLDELKVHLQKPGCRIGVVTGVVSKHLECIDFDDPSVFELWKELLYENGLDDIYARLVVERTPSGGTHCYYHCPEGVERNQKLARRPATPAELKENPKSPYQVTIETRGNGGLVVCQPSPNYVALQSDMGHIPTISAVERLDLFEAARHFEQVFEEKPQYVGSKDETATGRPGDDYNNRAEWSAILEPHGWVITAHIRERTYWRRPGKSNGEHSATTGNGPKDYLYVHSTSCHPLDSCVPYTKFGVKAIYDFGGDFASCAKALFKEGFGERTQPLSSSEVEEKPRSRFKFQTIDEVMQTPEKPMIIEDLLGRGDLWMYFGPSGAGKTFHILDMLISCAIGGTWAEHFSCVRPLKVAYCYGEGKYGIPRRMAAALEYQGLTIADIRDTMRFLPDVPQLHQREGDRSVWRFVEMCEDEGFLPDIFVLDTKGRATLGGKEDDNAEANMVCDLLTEVSERLDGCSPGFVHHTGHKDDHPRGASAYVGAMDLILEQKLDQEINLGELKLYKGKDIKPFKPIPFKIEPHMGTAVSKWLSESGSCMTAVKMLFATNRNEWLTAAHIISELPEFTPNNIRSQLSRGSRGNNLDFETKGSEPLLYRRSIKKR